MIGYGYWGPNIVRNFHNTSNAAVVSVCDLNPKSLDRVRKSYPSVAVTTDPADILNNPDDRCRCHRDSGLPPLSPGEEGSGKRETRVR